MRFTIRSAQWGDLTWEEGLWSGNPLLISVIADSIEAGDEAPTIYMGPDVKAASQPAWVAWYTARYALRDIVSDGDWSDQPAAPPDLFDVPEGAII